MTDKIAIIDEHGHDVHATRQELMDRCTLLRASKAVQWHLTGDSSPLLNLIQGHQPAHEQDDDQPIKDWSLERLAAYWTEYRDDYVEMAQNGELIGSVAPDAMSGVPVHSHTHGGRSYSMKQLPNGKTEISRTRLENEQ